MKQSTRTLPQAVKLFPESWKKELYNNIPADFYKLGYSEKIKYEGAANETYFLTNKDNKLFFSKKLTVIKRSGRTFYPSISWSGVICIEGTKITINKVDLRDIKVFLSIIGLHRLVDDFSRCEQGYFFNKSVLADILRKKVYSEETFYRCVLSKIYKLKDFNWRLFKAYTNCSYTMSIPDLIAFTRSLSDSLKVLVDISSNSSWSKYQLLHDMLKSAVKLNQVIDFTWSDKRLKEEHDNQNRLINLKNISEKKTIPIYDYTINTDNIKMLNTEKEVFLEGLNMHHCLYNCYWNDINNHKHIAFHMNAPENCTFSFKLNDNKDVILDQAFLAYNHAISSDTRSIITNFMKTYSEQIKILLLSESNALLEQDFTWDLMLPQENLANIPF